MVIKKDRKLNEIERSWEELIRFLEIYGHRVEDAKGHTRTVKMGSKGEQLKKWN